MSASSAERYRRQLQLAEVGPEGQARLAAARALVVGAGGLGCAALPYLAGAGLRALVVCDGDAVEPSNLPRQVLYGDDDLGRPKAVAAAARLSAQNRGVAVTAVAEPLSADNVAALVAAADVVLDCTDDFAARYRLHDACHAARRPLVTAAVHHDEGQLAVLRFDRDPAGPCWRCLWPRPPVADACGGGCRDQGILGTVPGLLGAWQADQALRILLDHAPLPPGELLHVDLATPRLWRTRWSAAPDCPLCGNPAGAPADVAAAAPGSPASSPSAAPAAAPATARLPDPAPEESGWDALAEPAGWLWIDARADVEHALDPQPAALAGLEVVPWRAFGAGGPPPDRPCVVFCGHGLRSLDLARHWRRQGLLRVTSLRGGLAAQRRRRT